MLSIPQVVLFLSWPIVYSTWFHATVLENIQLPTNVFFLWSKTSIVPWLFIFWMTLFTIFSPTLAKWLLNLSTTLAWSDITSFQQRYLVNFDVPLPLWHWPRFSIARLTSFQKVPCSKPSKCLLYYVFFYLQYCLWSCYLPHLKEIIRSVFLWIC